MSFTNRSEEPFVVTQVYREGDRIVIQSHESGFGGVPVNGKTTRIKEGDRLVMETTLGSTVTGLRYADAKSWLYRKSDEQLQREHQVWLDQWEQEKNTLLEDNRQNWMNRETSLPDKYRKRLEHFRNVGKDFEREGWGYELIICELAEMYEHNGGVDDEAIMAYAGEHGTSGNQHDCAKALAKAETLEGFPAGLSPLTGSADYS